MRPPNSQPVEVIGAPERHLHDLTIDELVKMIADMKNGRASITPPGTDPDMLHRLPIDEDGNVAFVDTVELNSLIALRSKPSWQNAGAPAIELSGTQRPPDRRAGARRRTRRAGAQDKE